ncbi:TPA: 3-deoxy-7-phosphoheptulonate synthase [Streptococcus agalactiae]|nr:3-deoxy-7-phosphoheptulonate synthase [Streptococcus agalactiae]
MGFHQLSDKVNIEILKQKTSLDLEVSQKKLAKEEELKNIIKGEDQRFLVIVGPCSADNPKAVLTYAKRLAKLEAAFKDKMFLVMRVYTAKPRTNGDGYKGLVHHSDKLGAFFQARKMHYDIIRETGLLTADELLYPEMLSVMDDLVSYYAIGARSVEDQGHRFISSGIDAPVGMKNPTSGNLRVMFNAVYAAQNQQELFYQNKQVRTDGNLLSHIILRGYHNADYRSIPNYHYENLLETITHYEETDLQNPFIVVDTNHDNSGKQFLEQIRIVKSVLADRQWHTKIRNYVRGFLIESYLEDGRQDKPDVFGKSITDPCLGWDKTEMLIRYIYNSL